jgi:hypothetical protein
MYAQMTVSQIVLQQNKNGSCQAKEHSEKWENRQLVLAMLLESTVSCSNILNFYLSLLLSDICTNRITGPQLKK